MAAADVIECISVRRVPFSTDGKPKFFKEFRTLREYFDRLPTNDDLATGSSVLFLNTAEYAEYYAPTKTWYLL